MSDRSDERRTGVTWRRRSNGRAAEDDRPMRLVETPVPPMRVEFVGGPGSGKSALSAHLVSALMLSDVGPNLRAYSLLDLSPSWVVNQRKVADAARFVQRDRARARKVGEIVAASGQSSKRHAMTKTVNLLAELARAAEPGPSVTEQGVLQAIASIQIGADRPVSAELLDLHQELLPTTVVRVLVDRPEQMRRLDQRSHGRSRATGAAGTEAVLGRIEHRLEELVLDWQATGDDRRLVTVHNDRGRSPSAVLEPFFTSPDPQPERSTA